jgi:hypothetical protein
MMVLWCSSFLEGARKEAKELLVKFNARDESRSLVQLISAQKGNKIFTMDDHRMQKSNFPSFIACSFAHLPKFHSRRTFIQFHSSGQQEGHTARLRVKLVLFYTL